MIVHHERAAASERSGAAPARGRGPPATRALWASRVWVSALACRLDVFPAPSDRRGPDACAAVAGGRSLEPCPVRDDRDAHGRCRGQL